MLDTLATFRSQLHQRWLLADGFYEKGILFRQTGGHVFCLAALWCEESDVINHTMLTMSPNLHRMPLMLSRSMSSFSDAHELPEIPIIAANLHRLILPRQSQIWAVLRKTDSPRRLIYSLAATFLGRMCLSGEVENLDPQQWQLVERAMELYSLATPVIKDGISRRFGEMGESWRHPQGWQAVVRTGRDANQALVI
jgi:hypothetical protein